jgi:RNA polymerase sigma-70 factor, ECF subfamily
MSVESRAAELVARGHVDEAATAVIEGLGPEILGYLRTVLRDEASANDAFSHFAESIWRGLPGFRGEASLRAWCYRVAWRAVLSEKRDPFRRRRERLETTMASRVAGRVFATTAVELERRSAALERLKATLQPEEQTLLTLRLDRRLSWREVADVLSEGGVAVDEAALRKRFERLKEKLARAAREKGLFD